MKIEIRPASNGVILKVRATAKEDGEEIVHQQVEGDDVEAFADFLRFLLDHYGPKTSRYSPKRIYVRVEPGDKFEAPANEEITRE